MLIQIESQLIYYTMMFFAMMAMSICYYFYRLFYKYISYKATERTINQVSRIFSENEHNVRDACGSVLGLVEQMEKQYYQYCYMSKITNSVCSVFNKTFPSVMNLFRGIFCQKSDSSNRYNTKNPISRGYSSLEGLRRSSVFYDHQYASNCPATECLAPVCPVPRCPTTTCPLFNCPQKECPTTFECPTTTCPLFNCPQKECPTTFEYPTTNCPLFNCPQKECPATFEYPTTTCPLFNCPQKECSATTCPFPESIVNTGTMQSSFDCSNYAPCKTSCSDGCDFVNKNERKSTKSNLSAPLKRRTLSNFSKVRFQPKKRSTKTSVEQPTTQPNAAINDYSKYADLFMDVFNNSVFSQKSENNVSEPNPNGKMKMEDCKYMFEVAKMFDDPNSPSTINFLNISVPEAMVALYKLTSELNPNVCNNLVSGGMNVSTITPNQKVADFLRLLCFLSVGTEKFNKMYTCEPTNYYQNHCERELCSESDSASNSDQSECPQSVVTDSVCEPYPYSENNNGTSNTGKIRMDDIHVENNTC